MELIKVDKSNMKILFSSRDQKWNKLHEFCFPGSLCHVNLCNNFIKMWIYQQLIPLFYNAFFIYGGGLQVQNRTLAITTGYMIYDMMCVLYHHKSKADDLVHHLVTIFGLGAGLAYQRVNALKDLSVVVLLDLWTLLPFLS